VTNPVTWDTHKPHALTFKLTDGLE